MASYRVLIGIDYKETRAEPGDVVTDLPKNSATWMLEQGIIERVATRTTEED